MEKGLSLFTVNVRRGYPDVQDQKLNSHSKLNCITACIQAANAGADEALMLDPHGFVATCNSTHFFIVRRGEVWTSTGQYCIPGITRANMIRLCPRQRHSGVRESFLALRCLWRRRSLCHRHLRRAHSGAGDRRQAGAKSSVHGANGRERAHLETAVGGLQGTLPQGSRGGRSHDHSRHVVGPPQHLDRHDVCLWQPAGLRWPGTNPSTPSRC